MSLPSGSGFERELARYLLGDATEEEKLELERRYLGDAELLERLLEARVELVDAYVRGELIPRDREKLELRLADSPTLRERVVSARAFANELDKGQPGARTRRRFLGAFLASRLLPSSSSPRQGGLGRRRA